VKSSFLRWPLRQAAWLGLAAAALLCAGSASAQTQPLAFQVINLTLGGDPDFPVTDDLTFNNLLLTESFSDGTTATLTLSDPSNLTGATQNTLDTGPTDLISSGFSLVNSAGGTLSSATLTGTLGISGFPATPILAVDLETTPVDQNGPPRLPNTFLNAAFSSTLTFPEFAGAPAPSGIGIGQFSLVSNDPSHNYPPIFIGTINATTNPVPEASTTVSLGLMLALGLGALVVTRRRRAAN